MARPTEYPVPRVQILLRLDPRDAVVLKREARHLGISVNRLIETAVHDWIVREAGEPAPVIETAILRRLDDARRRHASTIPAPDLEIREPAVYRLKTGERHAVDPEDRRRSAS